MNNNLASYRKSYKFLMTPDSRPQLMPDVVGIYAIPLSRVESFTC